MLQQRAHSQRGDLSTVFNEEAMAGSMRSVGRYNIDTSPIPGDPQATIQKAQRIRSAALAPANPSAQDRSVAAQATRLEAQARQELQEERTKHIQNATSAPYSQSISPSHLFDVFA